MNSVRGRSQDEQEDRCRYAFAKGTVALRAVCDQVTVIAIGGDPITPDELNTIQHHLMLAFSELFGITRIGEEIEDDDERDAFEDAYSDGSAVSSLVQRPTITNRMDSGERCGFSRTSWPESRDGFYYNGDLPWRPNVTGYPGVDNEPGPPPDGWEVIVHEPPYRKAWKLIEQQ